MAAKRRVDPENEEAATLAIYQRQVEAARRLLAVKRAHDSFLEFVNLSMPDPDDPENPESSRYQAHAVHKLIISELEKVERGETLRLIINVHPRIGKSLLVSQRFPAWFVGRDPYRQVILASHTDGLAMRFGRANRDAMRGAFYHQVFPNAVLKKGSQSATDLEMTEGGLLAYRGIGGALTGLGADLMIIDDPLKSREEANSRTIRDKQWDWFTDDAMTRLMGGMGRVVIVMTRWHEDDLVGRLTNPKNPYYNPEIAKQYRIINIPAIIETEQDKKDDPFRRDYGQVLWEDRIPKSFLLSQRQLSPTTFAALYQGRPSPPEGNFFKRKDIKTYKPQDLPTNLRYYGASDHAVSLEQDRDPTCMGLAGVDEKNNIWIMPDLVWRQIETDDAVDAMLMYAKDKSRPILTWWAEKGHISKSIGPFLRKRMEEEEAYMSIDEKTPVKDKMTRAQAIHGRVSMGKVFFPEFAPWWLDAFEELLNFPNGTHDDFVDFIALFGIGLSQQVAAQGTITKPKEPQPGSIQWILKSAERLKKQTTQKARYLH
jgi:predicted phage terminase large subunit-like protein